MATARSVGRGLKGAALRRAVTKARINAPRGTTFTARGAARAITRKGPGQG